MTYIDGFVIAVPTANRDAFIHHASTADEVFTELGALRIVECWGDNVPRGVTTDFYRTVDAKDDETVCFSWVEWPDKETRDACMARMDELSKTDERFSMEKNPPPFDGKRMVYGGFSTIVDLGERVTDGYVQGFVIPVPEDGKEAYRKLEEDSWPYFRDLGAVRVVAAWQDDVPPGKQTDFFRSVAAEQGEKVVFAFMEWPSRAVCDAAAEKMQSGDVMPMPDSMPFDGKRMIYGGFAPVVTVER